MNEREPEAEQLLAAIRAAFTDVDRGEIAIREAEVIDSYGMEQERARARKLDTEKHWWEISDKTVSACRNALNHLDPQGWKFNLPRFMVYAVKDPKSDVADWTIYNLLMGTDSKELNDHRRARYWRLIGDQAVVVERFLRYMANPTLPVDSKAAQDALDRFWTRAAGRERK